MSKILTLPTVSAAPLRAVGVLLRRIAAFRDDARGTIAVMSALLVIPVLGLASLGVQQMQVSHFREKLQTVADKTAQAGAALDETLPEARRREETMTRLSSLLRVERLEAAGVRSDVKFARPAVNDGIVATVSLEASTPPLFTLMPGGARRVRVVASSGDGADAMATHLTRCHSVATQSQFESLGC